MQFSRTQELVKSLALHFLNNKAFNISILQLLCQQQKIKASTTKQQIQEKMSVIDKGFQLLKQNIKAKGNKKQSKQFVEQSSLDKTLFNIVDIFIFNVSAMNQQYISQFEKKHMAQVTASQSLAKPISKTLYKQKIQIQFIKQHLRLYFHIFTQKSKFLHETINQILGNQGKRVSQGRLGLLQTLDYLCVKYSISNVTVDRIIKILQMNGQKISENMPKMFKDQSVKQVNKVLFVQSRQLQLFQNLQLKFGLDLPNIVSMIDSNYYQSNPVRRIFNQSQISGREVMEGLIVNLLTRVGKNQLFTQKNQDYLPFRVLVYHFLNRNFKVYMEFNALIKRLMRGSSALDSQDSIRTLRKIQGYFRIFVSIQNPSFHQTIQFIYNQLRIKNNQSTSLDLIKKLLLNRLLLNPSFYVLYNEPNQNQIKRYVEVANAVRALFYPIKAEQLAQQMNSPQLRKISDQICKSFEVCMNEQQDTQLVAQNCTLLYVNDKILRGQMQQFYHELRQSPHIANQGVNIHNMASDCSLSFSMLKNDQLTRKYLTSNPLLQNISQVKLPADSNRSNPKENQSIRFIYDQLKGIKSQNQITQKSLGGNIKVQNKKEESIPQKSFTMNNKVFNEQKKNQRQNCSKSRNRTPQHQQSAEKQDQKSNQAGLNSLSDGQIIDELVQMRKQYGSRKRSIKENCQARKQRKQKKTVYLNRFSVRFNEYKNQIQRQSKILNKHDQNA